MDKYCPICNSTEIYFHCKAILSYENIRDIYSCRRCQTKFYLPIPEINELNLCYENNYFINFKKDKWRNYYRGKFIAKHLASWKDNGSILEIGCANGDILRGIRDFSGWKVFGIETSSFASKYARDFYHLDVKTGSIENQYPNNQFDFILVNNVLEHVNNPISFLNHVSNLLKQKGRLLLSVPNGTNDISPNKILWDKELKPFPTKHRGHIFFFDKCSLSLMFKKVGLHVLTWKTLHFQTALKNNGMWPGYLSKFSKNHLKPQKNNLVQESLNQRQSITRYPELYYGYRQFCKWLWKFSWIKSGADYEIFLYKNSLK